MSFTVEKVEKRFGPYVALGGVSLRVGRGEILALLGPSGCGKTTLLRILAGLERPDAGTVSFDGTDVTATSAAHRHVGLVFQHYALFEHMTVFENVAFGLRVRKAPGAVVRSRVAELLERVRLGAFAERLPSQLSGGQRQRVALARALATEPRVLLLDEPFGALDARVRQELRTWLRQLHSETHVTTILVTHDRDDAFEVADRVAVMNAGQIEQVGSREEVFRHPSSVWVMRFLGDVNEFPVVGGSAVGYVRPHELDLSKSGGDDESRVARVHRIQAIGGSVRIEMDLEGTERRLIAEVDERRFEELALACGQSVYVSARRMREFAASH